MRTVHSGKISIQWRFHSSFHPSLLWELKASWADESKYKRSLFGKQGFLHGAIFYFVGLFDPWSLALNATNTPSSSLGQLKMSGPWSSFSFESHWRDWSTNVQVGESSGWAPAPPFEGLPEPRQYFLISPSEDQTLFNSVEVLYQDKIVFWLSVKLPQIILDFWTIALKDLDCYHLTCIASLLHFPFKNSFQASERTGKLAF